MEEYTIEEELEEAKRILSGTRRRRALKQIVKLKRQRESGHQKQGNGIKKYIKRLLDRGRVSIRWARLPSGSIIQIAERTNPGSRKSSRHYLLDS
jgi:hypothetical protein